MTVCIAGMHRSGTSMIAGLLKQTGTYLGADEDFLPAQKDNPLGFWEHFGFYTLNERLLLHLGAGWDVADLPDGWAARDDLAPFRDVARQLIGRMSTAAGGATWGWKDPRNSITIPFWKALLPDLRVVVCVRNPLDVASSLKRRNDMSLAAAGRLWLHHYQSLLTHLGEHDRVVTRYENYFADPHGELMRVLGKLGIHASTAAIAGAVSVIDPSLHHHHTTIEQLLASDCPSDIVRMYVELCGDKNALQQLPPASLAARFFVSGSREPGDHLRSRFHAETAQREEQNQRLARENTELRQLLEETKRKTT